MDEEDSAHVDFREVPPGSVLDEFHFDMWAGCMKMLIEQDEARAAFEAETGTPKLLLARTPLDRMIDEACGTKPLDYVVAFCRWATPAYWGDASHLSPAIIAKLAA